MNLNTYLLATCLQINCQLHSTHDKYICNLKKCHVWSSDILYDKETVYIIDNDAYEELSISEKELSFVVIGNLSESSKKPSPPKMDLICVPGYLTVGSLFIHITDIFNQFSVYKYKLKLFCMQKESWNHISQILPIIFHMPIMCLGEFREILHIAQTKNDLYDIREFLDDDSDYLKYDFEQAVNLVSLDKYGFGKGSTENGLSFLMYCIKIDGISTSFLLIDYSKILTDYHRIVLKNFAYWYTKYRCNISNNRYEYLTVFRNAFQKLQPNIICDNNTSQFIQKNMRRISWNATDTMLCILLHTDLHVSSDHLYYMIKDFPLISNHSLILNEENTLYLCNISQAKLEGKQLHSILQQYMSMVPFDVGVSLAFKNFSNYPLHLQQAQLALEIGQQINYMQRIYYYQEYVCDYLIHHGIHSLPLESVLPEGFKEIMEYDKTHHTTFLETIRIYFQNDMKLNLSAKILGIHVSTLKYRLQKIKKMINMDIYDPDNKLYIGLLFYLV